jgi:hypothetical protein
MFLASGLGFAAAKNVGRVAIKKILHPAFLEWPVFPGLDFLNVALFVHRFAILVRFGSVQIDRFPAYSTGWLPVQVWVDVALDWHGWPPVNHQVHKRSHPGGGD